ncbi:DeoR/GlpR transcriptional regulator [Agrobacterium vitis]|uniref:DeoR/GlpR family DNA-binding transcription regulator n=1 Tax=Agrobacterium vitis TaxID=373 RepID=UPI0018D2157F|nr:DeoR/GlpR family DNA-binding transcription regulator [Agrobacterium vitis]MCM2441347.1 DeoR/GlpR transcriptional regulator [Agrobacterium vitis]
MLTEERLDRIREQLTTSGKVLASELAIQFEVSEDTVRRDLRELAKLGFCRRVYGGALLPTPDLGTLATRTALHQDRKSNLARTAAGLIEDGQTIFIDAGSTNLAIANALNPNQTLTIVTNAPVIATALSDRPNYTIIVLGGMYDQGKGACLGPQAMREAAQIFADIFVIGACGVDSTVGITALDAGEAELKRTMVTQSSILLVAVTAEKIATVAPFKVADASMIDHLIVEHDNFDAGDFARADVQVHVASDSAPAAA